MRKPKLAHHVDAANPVLNPMFRHSGRWNLSSEQERYLVTVPKFCRDACETALG
ncbi:MAG: hypothetical protein RMK57_13870 [Bryobacterales bacterium]|nr:hypothetical protein [Bryobacteraceae bacterium]MDW8355608.1 hypothetical protein [Bryobacterales bacterium]